MCFFLSVVNSDLSRISHGLGTIGHKSLALQLDIAMAFYASQRVICDVLYSGNAHIFNADSEFLLLELLVSLGISTIHRCLLHSAHHQ